MLLSFAFAENVTVSDEPFRVEVISSDEQKTVIEYNLGSFDRLPIVINGEKYYRLVLEHEANILEKGNPSLPKITRSIVIPDDAQIKVKVVEKQFVEIAMPVAPSKGTVVRTQNWEDVPYSFSKVYQLDDHYPGIMAELGSPYIMRDFRGVTVTAYPFSYNPKTQLLKVYTYLKLEVTTTGISQSNVKHRTRNLYSKYFEGLYSNHFINFPETRYDSVDEHGKILVICYGSFMDAIQPYVDWKNQKGIMCELVNVADIGSNSNAIKNFIQGRYDGNTGITFVQLIGDHAQIPTIMVSNGGGGGSDASYALLEGNDNYPEIFIGRFSAENTAQVETQVERTIHYERDISEGAWLPKGCGIGSNQGPGDDNEYDDDHLDVIRQKLLSFTYTEVDQIYDPSGTDQQGIDAINDGRGIINYTGHGSATAWGNGASLNINQVNNLTNDYMLPHIITVGCVNGAFENMTCFAETWQRATNNTSGVPTGGIAHYASTINQYWDEPMRAQDHAMDLLVGYNYSNNQPLEQKNTIGGLYYNGSCNMMDVYGSSGIDMFLTWIIFGDASLQVRTDTPESMTISHSGMFTIGNESYDVSTGVEDALVSLSENSVLLGSGYTGSGGDVSITVENQPTGNSDLTLTVTAFNKITQVDNVTIGSVEESLIVDHSADWNLIGLPLTVEDPNYLVLFPDAIEGTLYNFYGGYYSPPSDLEHGRGSWLRFESEGSNTITGETIEELPIMLYEDWNLISGISSEVDVNNIIDPDNVIVPNTIFEFNVSYSVAQAIEPGKGYWVRAFENGEITISSSSLAKRAEFQNQLVHSNSITLNGQTLYFGMEVSQSNKLSYSLPPKPPVGGIDARFTGDWKYSESGGTIEIMNPKSTLSVEYDVKLLDDQVFWTIVTENGEQFELNSSGVIELDGDIRELYLKKTNLPLRYSLSQNYPNPFNPVTTFNYELPKESFVTISVYNILGQKVSDLVSDVMKEGFHSVMWNGTNDLGESVASGVYLYSISAENFHTYKKLVYMK